MTTHAIIAFDVWPRRGAVASGGVGARKKAGQGKVARRNGDSDESDDEGAAP